MPDPAHHDPSCIFCKIAAGQIPCHKIFENDDVLAFLDIEPLSHGHVLVIPKAHYVQLDHMPATTAAACGSALPAIARAVLDATGAGAWNLLQNNGSLAHQAVMHVHFHIIPKTDSAGLGLRWQPTRLSPDAGKQLAQQLRDALAR